MTDLIHRQVADNVLTITFNRPEKKNAITAAMYAAAADALRAADQDPDLRAIVLTGAGEAFSAGNDLKDFLENPPASKDAPVFQFMRTLSTVGLPVIAAVNGVAVGIGTTLLLHCDLVYATPEARFQLPFVNLALVPEFASTLLLPRVLGRHAAAELILLAEPFSASRAHELGIVNEIVAKDSLAATVSSKTRILAAKAPAALRATKALLRKDDGEVARRIDEEAVVFGGRLSTAEFKEVASAFLEKRAPDFSRLK
jgi:enoyl-CoA hydratase/carnithine racemase